MARGGRRNVSKRTSTTTNGTKPNKNKKLLSKTNQQLKELYGPNTSTTSTSSGSSTSTSFSSSTSSHLIVMCLAFGAVWFELTTARKYLHSKTLGDFLKKCFIAFVCLSSRKILTTGTSNNKRHHSLVFLHSQNLLIAICANCAGTSIIQPLFSQSPQYASTIEQVIPIYFLIEFLLLCGLSSDFLQGVCGFFVGYMKALTVVKLVIQWNEMFVDKNPMTFVLICTANLFASGIILRLIGNYYTFQKNWTLNFLFALIQMMLTSTLFGIFAHFATIFETKSARQWETFGLYFLIAWYTLDKYWRGSLLHFLVSTSKTNKQNATTKVKKD